MELYTLKLIEPLKYISKAKIRRKKLTLHALSQYLSIGHDLGASSLYREGNRETHRELQCHPQLYFEKPFKMLNKNNLSSDFIYNIHMT